LDDSLNHHTASFKKQNIYEGRKNDSEGEGMDADSVKQDQSNMHMDHDDFGVGEQDGLEGDGVLHGVHDASYVQSHNNSIMREQDLSHGQLQDESKVESEDGVDDDRDTHEVVNQSTSLIEHESLQENDTSQVDNHHSSQNHEQKTPYSEVHDTSQLENQDIGHEGSQADSRIENNEDSQLHYQEDSVLTDNDASEEDDQQIHSDRGSVKTNRTTLTQSQQRMSTKQPNRKGFPEYHFSFIFLSHFRRSTTRRS